MEENQAYITEHCAACRKPLKPGAVFCPNCDPPRPPPARPEGGITLRQATVRIALIVLVFAGAVALKADIPWDRWFAETGEVMPDEENRPQDEDFEVIHYVNVDRANVRKEPDLDSEVITVVGKGVRIKVIEKNEDWSRVDLDGRTGWVATELLSARVE